jgi:hypothetical protein
MKMNKHVPEVEYILSESDSIVSNTDLLGVITYANDAFIHISRYSKALRHQPGKLNAWLKLSKLPSQSGFTMEVILKSVHSVVDRMSEITAASVEQSAGIEQINQAITQMDDATQQNAALVEPVAAESLENLARTVGCFRINKDAPCPSLSFF